MVVRMSGSYRAGVHSSNPIFRPTRMDGGEVPNTGA